MNKKTIICLLLRYFKTLFVYVGLIFSFNCLAHEMDDSEWYSPIRYIVNGSFDVAQNDNWFNQSDFFKKNKTLWKRVKSPLSNIKKDGGYLTFFKDEFLSERAIPNILLHTVGGAYDGLWLTEYYKSQQFSNPFFYAIATSYLARWGNEVLEAGNDNITSHDHIADLLFFDSVGLALSRNKKVMRFFIKDLNMRAWHSIPYYEPDKDNFINSGLNYIIRPSFFQLTEELSPFFYFGMQNIIGFSASLGDHVYSFGTGIFLTNPLERKMRVVTSFFYETNQRLAFSAFINGSEGFKWRFNIYPSLLNFSRIFKLSVFTGEKRVHYNSDYRLGINFNMPFGIGGF